MHATATALKAQLPQRRQIWFRSALQWAQDIHALPGLERG